MRSPSTLHFHIWACFWCLEGGRAKDRHQTSKAHPEGRALGVRWMGTWLVGGEWWGGWNVNQGLL